MRKRDVTLIHTIRFSGISTVVSIHYVKSRRSTHTHTLSLSTKLNLGRAMPPPTFFSPPFFLCEAPRAAPHPSFHHPFFASTLSIVGTRMHIHTEESMTGSIDKNKVSGVEIVKTVFVIREKLNQEITGRR